MDAKFKAILKKLDRATPQEAAAIIAKELAGRTGIAALSIKQGKGYESFRVRIRVTDARPAFGRLTLEVEPETSPFAAATVHNRIWINAKAVVLDKEAAR